MVNHASMKRVRNYFLPIIIISTVGTVLLFLSSNHLNPFNNCIHNFNCGGDDSNVLNPIFQDLHPEASPSTKQLEVQKYFPYCPPDKCSHGHWVPRIPPFETYEEVERFINIYHKHGLDPGNRLFDPEPEPEPLSGVRITEEQRRQRLVEMANWVWEPGFGKVVPFDAEELVVRLLKSAAGLFVIGDSVTIHWFYTIHHRIHQAGLILEEYHEGPLAHAALAQWRLDMNHPACQELVQRAGIPLSRAQRPILTHIATHMLITPNELKKIFRAEWGYVHHHYHFMVEGWHTAIAELTTEKDGEREKGVNEDSLVVVSNGPHWSRLRLRGYVEETDYDSFRRRIEYGYHESIKVTMANLATSPHTTLFFRSISPGHPRCAEFPVPFSSMHEAEDWSHQPGHDKPDPEEWDWDRFPSRNEMWRKAIREYEEERTKGDGVWNGRGNKWIYLDNWEMDFQRVDSHTGYWDCLHYVLPFQHNQWTDMLFHRLFVEERLNRTQRAMHLEPMALKSTA
ncbi:hypothetical protein D9758_015739 [Tetrapyrgos nigripes]|uniref:Uncharacterized protein n=1 Tax=Tetrapyrgos nigripes TaxID=182062 RepID=A0A8H5FRT9_9AGAR|nr:hypothetical protein D9758_015739 [Tetrapyrgos nigripes]